MDPQLQDAIRTAPPLAIPQFWIVWLADDVVADYQRRGRAVDWPPGMDIESAWHESHYPADVWNEAVNRWDAMPRQEQEAYKASVTSEIVEGMDFDELVVLAWWFIQSFTLFDILWVGLAVVTCPHW